MECFNTCIENTRKTSEMLLQWPNFWPGQLIIGKVGQRQLYSCMALTFQQIPLSLALTVPSLLWLCLWYALKGQGVVVAQTCLINSPPGSLHFSSAPSQAVEPVPTLWWLLCCLTPAQTVPVVPDKQLPWHVVHLKQHSNWLQWHSISQWLWPWQALSLLLNLPTTRLCSYYWA